MANYKENLTCRKFRRVANNRKAYNMKFYNLEAATQTIVRISQNVANKIHSSKKDKNWNYRNP
jgi:hypothetical protein